jgi:hypothetical protein
MQPERSILGVVETHVEGDRVSAGTMGTNLSLAFRSGGLIVYRRGSAEYGEDNSLTNVLVCFHEDATHWHQGDSTKREGSPRNERRGIMTERITTHYHSGIARTGVGVLRIG